MPKRSILRLKRDELVPPEEDRQLEIAMYDLLQPCGRFDVAYKVAVWPRDPNARISSQARQGRARYQRGRSAAFLCILPPRARRSIP